MRRAFLIAVFLLVFHSLMGQVEAQNSIININIDKIISIESAGNAKAFNRHSQARGLCQITPICLKDYNQFHKVKYSTSDLFTPQINIQIAQWYLNVRIPQMLRHYNRTVSVRNILICYNAGIQKVISGKLPDETRKYISRYGR